MIPGSANPLLLASAAAAPVQIERSLRFNSSDSAYLSRTPAVAGNRKTWTWAGWVKRSALGSSAGSSEQYVFRGGAESTNNQGAIIIGSDTLYFIDNYSTAPLYIRTTQVLRDPSAWYHIVVSIDTTQATSTNRAKLYINGAQVTTLSTATYPSQNYDTFINQVEPHTIGRRDSSFPRYFDGYLADVHFIDGQALTPSSFTEVSATTGRIEAKLYAGSFGTNGFWLPFNNNSTAAVLGTDYSGNSNTWTVNNLSVTAGAGNDSLVDTPTSFGTDTSVGGEVRGNYCTWNPLINGDTAANGNLDVTNDTARGTQKLLEYAAYWEITSIGGTTTAGVVSDGGTTNTTTVANGKTYGFKLSVAGSLDYINITDGGSFTSITTGLTGIQFPYASAAASTTGSLNAGQRPFAATAPSGFKALCDTNLPAPLTAKPNTLMDVITYTGTGATQTLPNASSTPSTSLAFSPDFVWIKCRSTASTSHTLADSVRGLGSNGAYLRLFSNSTAAEVNDGYDVTALNAGGFTLTDGDYANATSRTYVAWAWDAGTSTVSNTAGSITSQVRANVSAGLSVVSWSANNTANQSIGHGLGVTPAFIIHKNRTTSGNWNCWFTGFSNDEYINLNDTGAKASTGGGLWYQTPTSSLFYIGFTGSAINNSTNAIISYCFAPVVGYSSMGSYVGNGSADGPFIYTGMRPRWVMIKNSSATANWLISDSARDPSNLVKNVLLPNLSNAEDTAADYVDFVSNGFKIKAAPSAAYNANGNTYVFVAFAENPFQYARAR